MEPDFTIEYYRTVDGKIEDFRITRSVAKYKPSWYSKKIKPTKYN